LLLDLSKAFGYGDFATIRKRCHTFNLFTNAELEYAYHRMLKLVDISFLFGMHYDFSLLQKKVRKMYVKGPDGSPEVVETMDDGFELYDIKVAGVRDDHSDRSREWLRNYFADCVPSLEHINEERTNWGGLPLDRKKFIPIVPRLK